ncbi:PQQ-binding-like beta-propeller repeat protein [Halorussus gelatinilyticus]|uniref:PQQ-binding-like beta-propeller repeat protein n=1 Tax=Halorussus gelatinilyticus TaxID=2937524 RepID=A0A8U0II03_9EURY|nr:PQQ-binding-like beta-propeller repeat protein [Halorussus gelatinilyticus]UPV99708.1 PQQ-binding-like beta-propeller repeat protein [Halorussus gelatinilyticus]
MTELSRRQVLAGLGTAAVGVGGYRWFEDGQCLDRREPNWAFHGEGWSAPFVGESAVYASENHGTTSGDMVSRVVSLRRYDGSANWVFTVTGGGAGVPLVADGSVYFGTGADYVYALDRRTGHVEWEYDAGGRETYGGGAWGQPAKTDGRVLVGISHSEAADVDPTSDRFTHRVVALDDASGEEVWATDVDETVWAGPEIVGDTVVAGTEAGSVYGLAVEDGRQRWRTEVGEMVWEDVFADESAVHVASDDGRVAALAPDSGAERWTRSISGTVSATERDGERFFVGTERGAVVAFSRSTGEERWRVTGERDGEADEAPGIADLASDGSLAFVFDHRGYVRVFDAASGERRDRFRVAEKTGRDGCGWSPRYRRGKGLALGDDELYLSGPWVQTVDRYRKT